jgi:tape measure domain-containing protein
MSLLGTADLGVAFTGDIGDLLRASSQAGNAVDGFGQKAGSALRDVTKEARQTDDAMGRMANGIKSAFVGSSVAVGLITLKNQVVSVVSALTDAQVQVDRLKNGFSFGAGGAAAGAREMAFVRSEADRLGLSLNSTAASYMKMVAASRGNTMAGEKTRELFLAISEASVVMGLGQDQTERSMAAVVQMMSKGKVQAEELRGQLGEHLPGAFAIAARAMGVTEVELNKMMETGSVLSEDFLPRFAAQLRKELAGSVEQSALSMQANLNRLSTAWLDFKQQVVQGGVGEGISKAVSMAAADVSVLGDVFEASRVRGEGAFMALANAAGAVAGRAGFGLLEQSAELLNGTINLLTGGVFDLNTSIDIMPDNLKPVAQQMEATTAKIKAAEAEYAILSARLATQPDSIWTQSQLSQLDALIKTLRVAQGEQRKLMGLSAGSDPIGSVGSGDAALARAQRADYDRQKAARDKFMFENRSASQKMVDEIAAQKKAMGELYSPEVEAMIRERFVKPTRAGGRAAREAKDEFGELFTKLSNKDVGLDPSFYKDLNTLHDGYKTGRISVDEYRAAVEMLVTNQKFAKDAMKEHADAVQAAAQSNNAAWDAEFEALEKKRLSNEAQIKTGRETLEQIQFETSLLGLNTLQREQAVAMRELERQGIVAGTQAYNEYAEAIQKALADRAAQQKTIDFWRELESTASDVFMDLALNGESAFKRLGESLKREVIRLLYEMTIKKWIFQISGVGGGGSAGSIIDYASSAYSAYTTAAGGGAGAAGAVGGSASAAGSYLGGSMSAANTYGSIYANTTGTGINGLLATNGAYGTAGAGGVSGSTTASAMGYMGYAALIAAAVMIAENLYAKGYNRAALGKGPGESNTVGNTTFQADSRYGNSSVYNGSAENFNFKLFDAIGLNEKWATILSGTTRMAALFGRKLGAYGFTADIAGGDAEVGGFQRYKGGVFRSNKTVDAKVDPKDAANFDAIVESTIEGSKAMARAMGYSDEAINAYTGSLKVNFKGAKTAEEQAERVATAMDDLNFELLKTASGGKLAREDFKQMMEGIQKDIGAAGISGEGIADILVQGMTGRLSGADVGDQLASMIVGGIYNAIASSYAAQIAQLFMNQIITPIFTAIAAGVPITQAVSAASIKATVATAKQYMAVVGALFNDPDFRRFMEEFKAELGSAGASAAAVAPPAIRTYSGPSAASTAADEAKREKEQLEREILQLQGNTVELRRRELLEIKPGNRALQQRVWALEDEKEILDERKDLERELLELQGDTAALRALERNALHESNRALYDQIKALEDVAELKDTWSSVIDAMSDEMKRLREEILGTTPEGRAYAAAEFATATAQARAGDTAAAERLPDLARTLVEIASESSASLSDLRAVQGSTLASLAATREILGATYGIELPKFAVGTNYVPRDMVAMIHEGEAIVPKAFNPAAGGGSQAELVAEIRGLRADIQAVKGLGVGQLAALGRVEQLLDGVTNGGTSMRTREVTA